MSPKVCPPHTHFSYCRINTWTNTMNTVSSPHGTCRGVNTSTCRVLSPLGWASQELQLGPSGSTGSTESEGQAVFLFNT